MANARLLILALLGITATFAQPSSRILGGQDASSGEYPWVASVRLDNVHVCVGSILSNLYILTAGHCLSEVGSSAYEASRISARVGSINQYASGSIVAINRTYIHPSYGNFMHDLALVELKEPLEWSTKIQSIQLAGDQTEIPDDSELLVSGWGLQLNGASPYKLQHTILRSIGSPECEYRAGYGYPSVLCLSHDEKQGICRGDGGAGAVLDNQLVGVASFSFGGCGTKYPDIFARVTYYRDWINSIIN